MILDRLRPLYIQELGLENSVQTLLQDAKAQAPGLEVTSEIDPGAERGRGPAVARPSIASSRKR